MTSSASLRATGRGGQHSDLPQQSVLRSMLSCPLQQSDSPPRSGDQGFDSTAWSNVTTGDFVPFCREQHPELHPPSSLLDCFSSFINSRNANGYKNLPFLDH